jgi:ParB family transcriptional regulator, chromosome partitioning protein
MAKTKQFTGLGKGLEALLPTHLAGGSSGVNPFGPAPSVSTGDDGTSVGITAMVELHKIRPNKMQPREDFDPVALDDLKKSIKEKGVIQPITVRRVEEGMYEIIAGERRFRASREIGMEKIPAYILDIEFDVEMLELALIENVQRENLNPIEVALGYRRLMDECGLIQEEVARKVGKDRTTITNFLRLLRLPSDVQIAVRTKQITMGHARSLLALSQESDMTDIYHAVVEHELSVRKTEELVKVVEHGTALSKALATMLPSIAIAPNQQAVSKVGAFIAPAIPDEPPASSAGARTSQKNGNTALSTADADNRSAILAHESAITNELQQTLATHVKIRARADGSGTIEIEFYSSDDLERLRDLLLHTQL